jgi:hypothetical protein
VFFGLRYSRFFGIILLIWQGGPNLIRGVAMNRKHGIFKQWSGVILLIIALIHSSSFAKYSGGSGEPNNPYQIADVNDLLTLANDANDYNKCFILTADIDLDPCLPGNKVFTTAVIAWDAGSFVSFDGTLFDGVFDGAGHKIINLKIDTLNANNGFLGLFGNLDSSGKITNLSLENLDVIGGYESRYIGGLCGCSTSGSIISNCQSMGNITGKQNTYYLGGLVGINNGTIENCSFTGDINCEYGSIYFGGLVGQNSGTINNCHTSGLVNGANYTHSFGGITGSSGTIIDSYSTSTVRGGLQAGFIGGLTGDNTGNIINCHYIGNIEAGDNTGSIGGIAGANIRFSYINIAISNCSSTGNISAGINSSYLGGLVGMNKGMIDKCFSNAIITADSNSILTGGLAGSNSWNYSYIGDSYFNGNVTGYNGVGGLAGRNQASAVINNSYSAGTVTGDSNVGGLIGNNYGNINNSYFLDIAGPNNGFGEPLTDAQMKQQASFIEWDFNNVWKIKEGVDYPKLLWSKYSGGSGTPYDPYQIADVNDLLTLANDANDYNKCFILTADINLTGLTFTQALIAPDINAIWGFQGTQFAGVFEGNGHTIFNLTVTAEQQNYAGLFGYIGSSGQVRNLSIVDVNITGSIYVGGLVGENAGNLTGCIATGSANASSVIGGLVGTNSGSLISCYAACLVSGPGEGGAVGGLVGENYSGTINNCHASGSVFGSGYVGGLVGVNGDSLTSCYSIASVAGRAYIGGVTGYNFGSVTSCYATGSVSGITQYNYYIGGLSGYNAGSLTYCYAVGSVTGYSDVGGLVGWNDGGVLTTCFWDTNTTGTTDGVGSMNPDPDGATGKTTAEMQMQNTFTAAGWDFTDIWAICEGTNYPKLIWQIPAGDIICPDGVDFFDLAELCQQWLVEEIPADLYPSPAGDGIVNFADFSVFADQWAITNDINDLLDFSQQWLKTGSQVCTADIAPAPNGDGRVNEVDFALMTQNWLIGL